MSLRSFRAALLASVLICGAPVVAHAEEELGPKVGAALQAAETALGKHDYSRAMAAVNEAQAVPGRSDYETYTIEQMRAAVASQSGDLAGATQAYDQLIASPRTSREARAQMLKAEGTMAYTAKDYPRAVKGIERYLKEVGPDAQMENLLAQAYYLQHDYANAARVQRMLVDSLQKQGKKPTEDQLLLLATCATQIKDTSAQTHAYSLLATLYPKPDYWAQLLHALVTNDRLPPSLHLDVYRIRLALGNLTQTADFMDATEIAVQMGLPQVGLDIMTQGYAYGALGQGPSAAREGRLRALVMKAIADRKASADADEASARQEKTGNRLVTVGYNRVLAGQVDQGLAVMKDGIAKGTTDLDISKLRLGEAEMDAGRTKDAIATFHTVGGDNGAADIARLWVLKLTSGK
ncbi:lipopolysaccharide assembly protein LapB [Acetobacter estunensis]|uniref:tetratricopeptide repeat protein n=1 Tax=Acetobacter estunensis TaxID=104097 RepID=UPI001C2CE48E|nr:hypothetical protein [Acetobacter estunensis]MBV1837739.1 hypothetical protein [Acetobacter estunensis]